MSACDITFAFVVWILLIVSRGESTTVLEGFKVVLNYKKLCTAVNRVFKMPPSVSSATFWSLALTVQHKGAILSLG